MVECKEFCSEHSGNMQKFVYLEKSLEEVKADLNFQKGVMQSKFDGSDKKHDDLRKELTDKMDEGFKRLENKMDEKEKKTNDKRWVLISTVASPIVVIGVQKLFEHFVK